MNTFSKNKPSSIQAMFNTIAKRYDTANWCMSMGLHCLWNRRLARQAIKSYVQLRGNTPTHLQVLDLCCGTGEITFRIASELPPSIQATLTGVDFSQTMIEIASSKNKKLQLHPHISIEFMEGDATELPFDNHSFDIITMAYGIRNIDKRSQALHEMSRILKPQGVACILELTSPDSRILQKLHSWYLRHIIPAIGALISGNKESYAYLSSSIEQFVHKDTLVNEMKEKFTHSVEAYSLLGGIATLFIGTKNDVS